MPCLVLREELKTLVAFAAAGVGKALPCFGNELPVIAAGLEGELQDSEGGGIVKSLEEGLDGEVVAVDAAGTEERLVPIGEGAGGGMRGEIGAEPLFLG